jgi:hypothetical protein
MKHTIIELVFAAATAPPDAQATETPTEVAFQRPVLLPKAETDMSVENYPALFDRALGHEGGY